MPPDPLDRALDEAIAGRRGPLFELLTRGSKLPGPRHNAPLADAFAVATRARGAAGDALALAMARLDADEAPGATALEFLPLCGVLALASRAASDRAVRALYVAELHARADDLRFRVREAVVDGLVKVGSVAGDELVVVVASWTDGYFHGAAVLRALTREAWLSKVHDASAALARLDEAFELARNAPRAAARYPGHKALLDALKSAPSPLALRFGVPVFDVLVRWAAVKDPVLRDLVRASLEEGKEGKSRPLSGRFGPDVTRVLRALEATEPAPRNPDHDFGPTRDRSGQRRGRGGRRRG